MVSLTAMRPSELLELHHARIREIALSHRVQDVRVFGSVRHGDDTETSDLDLLVEPTPQTTLFDIGAIRFELSRPIFQVLCQMGLTCGQMTRFVESEAA